MDRGHFYLMEARAKTDTKKAAPRRRKAPNWTISDRGRAIAVAFAAAYGCSPPQAVDLILVAELTRAVNQQPPLITEQQVITILEKFRKPDTGPDPLA